MPVRSILSDDNDSPIQPPPFRMAWHNLNRPLGFFPEIQDQLAQDLMLILVPPKPEKAGLTYVRRP